ncbi:hypothetical protein BT93_A1673 [Corymbia citriodora subsp. variegata]|nr:hypothetical protein BT93_A1673 [Corymbia citriodora subsp. variegata]
MNQATGQGFIPAMAKMKVLRFLLPVILLSLVSCVRTRPIEENSASDIIFEAVRYVKQPMMYLSRLISSDDCDQTYGFLPCTTTVWGNVFLILAYGYLMFLAAKLLSNGSEILLQILGPGIIGGLFLPILSSLPDATIILASGISGSTEDAQSQVSVGMGLLAGSTVMLLTVLWGTCIIVGRCDIENSTTVDQKDTKKFSLAGSGVSTDIWTSYAARIMMISIIPFIIVQLPEIFGASSLSRAAVLVSFIVSICLLLSYSLYQQLKARTLGNLITDEGKPNTVVIEKLFEKLDVDSNGYLTPAELRALIIGIHFEEVDINMDEAVLKVIEDFDSSRDLKLDAAEFVEGISKWLRRARRIAAGAHEQDDISLTTRLLGNFDERTEQQLDRLVDQEDELSVDDVANGKWNTAKAILMLLLGTAIAAITADPLVDAVDNFSTATSIPSFFVSFVILPFACSSEVVSCLMFSSRKKKRTTSLTYSEIYGSVTMGNVLSLAVFLGLVYVRQLTWDFFSEVLVTVIVCLVMGAIASFRTTFPLWMSFLAYALYPLSLLLVYVLDYVLGLS